MFEACGETELKALLAIRPGDSKIAVARKVEENRETIRRAVNRLKDAGYVTYDDGLSLVEPAVREAGLEFLTASAAVSPATIAEAYVLPHFAGLEFAYTGIDAVYVWTRGGYQVARDESDYPLFIAIRGADFEGWVAFFERFNIPAAEERLPPEVVDGPLHVVLEPREQLQATVIDGRPVVSLPETVAFARVYEATFEPALAMLDEMYEEIDIETDYRTELARS